MSGTMLSPLDVRFEGAFNALWSCPCWNLWGFSTAGLVLRMRIRVSTQVNRAFVVMASVCAGACTSIPFDRDQIRSEIAAISGLEESDFGAVSRCAYVAFHYGVQWTRSYRPCIFAQDAGGFELFGYDRGKVRYFSIGRIPYTTIQCVHFYVGGPSKNVIGFLTDKSLVHVSLLEDKADSSNVSVINATLDSLAARRVRMKRKADKVADPTYIYKFNISNDCGS